MARGILALLVVLVMPATSLQAAISPEERDALVSLYESTGGDEWLDRDGWLGAPGSECGWSGIVCNEGEDSVLRAALVENHLSGPLPEEIGNLSNLVELDLSGNQITGTIPVSIGSMIDLKILRLRDNDLRLPLPDSLFTLSTLEILDLSGNRLEGTVPGKVGSLGGLRSLDISYNAFRGEVPSELAALTSLEDGASDFRFNALTSADSEVSAFLDRKQREGNWTSTQTVPPVDVTSGQIIEWTPIEYRAGPGHYRIVVETQSGDSAGVFSTGSKSASSYELTVADVVGELVATVHTISAPHGRQKNLIVSEPSASTDFSIFGYAPDQPFYTVGVEPDPLIQVGGVPQNDTFFTVVNYGGLGGDALLEQTGDFFTLSETSFFIEKFSTRRIEVDSISQPVGEYEGEVRLSGDGTFQPIPVEISLLSLPSPPDAEGRPERRRLDLVSGRSTVRSSATFRNDGSEQLSGQITSDVPWIVPVTESISIDPGESALIEFEIDPLARPDGFSEEGVSFTGTLRLVYADELERTGKRAAPASQHTTGVSTTLATVVSTVPPEVSDAAIPALEPGENGFLVPGLQHGVDAFSDISIANAFGSLEIGDLRAFFASPGGVENSRLATFGELNRRSAILIGAPGPTVFER
ncbi:MAG: hypothetical protein R3338_06935, partial [Thermoanaerobaculia bacterium]|nr:hypothetical protein [Thermoanaerobaculia bacterium]